MKRMNPTLYESQNRFSKNAPDTPQIGNQDNYFDFNSESEGDDDYELDSDLLTQNPGRFVNGDQYYDQRSNGVGLTGYERPRAPIMPPTARNQRQRYDSTRTSADFNTIFWQSENEENPKSKYDQSTSRSHYPKEASTRKSNTRSERIQDPSESFRSDLEDSEYSQTYDEYSRKGRRQPAGRRPRTKKFCE